MSKEGKYILELTYDGWARLKREIGEGRGKGLAESAKALWREQRPGRVCSKTMLERQKVVDQAGFLRLCQNFDIYLKSKESMEGF